MLPVWWRPCTDRSTNGNNRSTNGNNTRTDDRSDNSRVRATNLLVDKCSPEHCSIEKVASVIPFEFGAFTCCFYQLQIPRLLIVQVCEGVFCVCVKQLVKTLSKPRLLTPPFPCASSSHTYETRTRAQCREGYTAKAYRQAHGRHSCSCRAGPLSLTKPLDTLNN